MSSTPAFNPSDFLIVAAKTFEQLEVGDIFRAPSRTLTDAHASAFHQPRQRGDAEVDPDSGSRKRCRYGSGLSAAGATTRKPMSPMNASATGASDNPMLTSIGRYRGTPYTFARSRISSAA